MKLSVIWKLGLVSAMVLSFSACGTRYTAPDPTTQALDVADRATGVLADDIDSVYLLHCEDPVRPVSDHKAAVASAMRQNGSRWTDCRERHNGLVDLLLNRFAEVAGDE